MNGKFLCSKLASSYRLQLNAVHAYRDTFLFASCRACELYQHSGAKI